MGELLRLKVTFQNDSFKSVYSHQKLELTLLVSCLHHDRALNSFELRFLDSFRVPFEWIRILPQQGLMFVNHLQTRTHHPSITYVHADVQNLVHFQLQNINSGVNHAL